jgi:hypothetical protein
MTEVEKQQLLRKLYRFRDKIREQMLGNDYYIAKELREVESKTIMKIKELEATLPQSKASAK